MTLQDKLNLIKNQFHLDIKEAEPLVYKVTNAKTEVDINELQQALEECILITSDAIENKQSLIAYTYYIILDYNRNDLKYKYHKQANLEFEDAVIDSYSKSREGSRYESIDTIYRLEELISNV